MNGKEASSHGCWTCLEQTFLKSTFPIEGKVILEPLIHYFRYVPQDNTSICLYPVTVMALSLLEGDTSIADAAFH